jgi:uncharacterized protein YjbI with pentapeptide repeats/type II secretory pathway pseudopilin PulG
MLFLIVRAYLFGKSGFSLMEVLGATAIAITLAAVSVVTIRDTILAGQRSAVQQELQRLNTAWQNFKSAGGVIEDTADARAAVLALKRGIDMEGTQFIPLTSDPPETLEIGGIPYTLYYDPDDGFSYIDLEGKGFGLGGQAVPGLMPPNTDITSSNFEEVLERLSLLDAADPEYADLLNRLALGIASGDLTDADVEAIKSSLRDRNLEYDPDTISWSPISTLLGYPDTSHLPSAGALIANYQAATDPAAYFIALSSLEQAALYLGLGEDRADLMLALRDRHFVWYNDPEEFDYRVNAGMSLFPDDMRNFLTSLPRSEVGSALNHLDWIEMVDLSKLDLTGWDTSNKWLYAINFSGSNITASQLNAPGWLPAADLSGLQVLQDFVTAGKDLSGVNFSGSNISAAQLNTSAGFSGADLSGLQTLQDLQTVGRYLGGINFTGSNISAEQLSVADANMRQINLSGLQNLQNFITVGKDLGHANFSGSNISSEQLSQASNIIFADLGGLDLQGFSAAGKSLWGVNFSNTNITADQLAESENLNSVNLAGTKITRQVLSEALSVAGKSGFSFILDSIVFGEE